MKKVPLTETDIYEACQPYLPYLRPDNCCYCDKKIWRDAHKYVLIPKLDQFTWEHIVPKSDGGTRGVGI